MGPIRSRPLTQRGAFFQRQGAFRTLLPDYQSETLEGTSENGVAQAELAIEGDAKWLADHLQGTTGLPVSLSVTAFADIAHEISFGYSGSELRAIENIIDKRVRNSTTFNVPN